MSQIEKRNPQQFNPDGDIVYCYGNYTELKARGLKLKSDDCPVLSHTMLNDLRLNALDLEYKATCVYGVEPENAQEEMAIQNVESRLYLGKPDVKSKPESTRGAITCVSYKSSIRLKKLLARVIGLDLWIDLTFADDVMGDLTFAERMSFSYKCLNEFERYIRSKGIHYVWKKEIQYRKSGDYKGARIPHYHVCLCCLSDDQKANWRFLCIDLLTKWVAITGTNHPHALEVALKLKHGVPQSYRRIEDTKTALKYIGKYFSKTDPVKGRADGSEKESIGRAWGNSRDIPLCEAEVYYLRPCESAIFRRIIKKYLKLPASKDRIGLREQLEKGLSTFFFADGGLVSRLINFCGFSTSEFEACPF